MTNPLKQGLKQDKVPGVVCPVPRRNDESTKTRIETQVAMTLDSSVLVVMTNPLKQGLKQGIEDSKNHYAKVVMTNPLKQGLKLQSAERRPKIIMSRNDESTKTRIETQRWRTSGIPY